MALSTFPTTGAYAAWKTKWSIENYLFWAQGNSLDWSAKSDKVKADGFGQRAHKNLAGMQDGVLKLEGLAQQERNTIVYQLRQWQGAPSPVNVWFGSQSIAALSPVTFFPAAVLDSSITGKIADATDFKTELDAQGTYTDGFILLTPQTLLSGVSGTGATDLNTVTINGSAVPTATTSGGAGVVHVYAYDGGTSPAVTVTVNHSPDGVTYTPLCSFNALSATGPQSQRIEVSPSTTINPYIQATWATTGSPTDVQVFSAFGRYPNLG